MQVKALLTLVITLLSSTPLFAEEEIGPDGAPAVVASPTSMTVAGVPMRPVKADLVISNKILSEEDYYKGNDDLGWTPAYEDYDEDEPLPDNVYPYFAGIVLGYDYETKVPVFAELKHSFNQTEETVGLLVTDMETVKVCRRQEAMVVKEILASLIAANAGRDKDFWNTAVMKNEAVCRKVPMEEIVMQITTRLAVRTVDQSRFQSSGWLWAWATGEIYEYQKSGDKFTVGGIIPGVIKIIPMASKSPIGVTPPESPKAGEGE